MLGNDNFLSSLSRFVVAIVFHIFSGSVLIQVIRLDLSFFALAYPWFPAFADGRLRHVLGCDSIGDSGVIGGMESKDFGLLIEGPSALHFGQQMNLQ